MYFDKLIDELAHKLTTLSADFDNYEFRDNYDSEENSIETIKNLLTKGDVQQNINFLIGFCEDVLESENEDLYSDAQEIIYDLQKISEFLDLNNSELDLMY